MKNRKTKIATALIMAALISGLIHLIIISFVSSDFAYLLSQSGEYTIWALIISLACTPLTTTFGWQGLRRIRKNTGIFAFIYGAVHLTAFFLKLNWDVMAALTRVGSELNLLLASISLLIMLLLFVTSNKAAIRKLGKRWKKLHRLVYPAAILGALHGILIDDMFSPHGMKYLILILVLLMARVPSVKGAIVNRRNRRQPKAQVGIDRGIRKPVFIILSVFGLLVIGLANGYMSNARAKEPYRYSRDAGFLATLFAPDKLPVVTHQQTLSTCGNDCHVAHQPGLLPERSWKRIMANLDDHFGEQVKISQDTREAIEDYLIRNAADYTRSKYSMKIMKSIGAQTPLRITEIEYFRRKHEEIPPQVIRHESVQLISNCRNCHIDADVTGDYHDRNVKMPDH